ncbi:MAG: glycerate kinase [Cyanobacteria bacterium REEB459]|nr:glycerate kinase [Cyanobacteria bacterium REEB459]
MIRPEDRPLAALLGTWLEAGQLTTAQWQFLISQELADSVRAQAWGLSPETVRDHLQQRLSWLTVLLPVHPHLPLPPAPLATYLPLYWYLWLPLALRLHQARQHQPAPLIQGILAGQGTGKTTLAAILSQILGVMGCPTATLSLDDLYKTWQERQQIQQRDPRLRWRGPPGTHDLDLGLTTLDRIRQADGRPLALPRFDKALHQGQGDRTTPVLVRGVEILLFEGWFVGVEPIPMERFDQAPAPISSQADRQFARDMNRQLAAYQPLWQRLDRLLLLLPRDYRQAQHWRQQAEHQLRAAGRGGMDRQTVREFVEYFWRSLHPELFITPLTQRGDLVDLVIEVDSYRYPRAIYSPPRPPSQQGLGG